MKLRKLTEEEEDVIVRKGTERPFAGIYDKFFEAGTYICKRCGASLYRSEDKFDAGCGWPSFDDEIKGAVRHVPDPDGVRTEIRCARCGAHLGHLFTNEGFTPKNVRHCVNSVSMDFVPAKGTRKPEKIVLGAGCFWCTEAVFRMVNGVVDVTPGYAGGKTKNPTYEEVCGGKTGHAEAAMIEYDPSILSLGRMLEIFFAMHDPTSLNMQGSDIGTQYRSIILYASKKQKDAAEAFVKKIRKNYNKPIVTEIKKLAEFYPAEDYHKKYFEKNPGQPYCRLAIVPEVERIKKDFGDIVHQVQ